ncbi:conserved protein of unknown function (plasmid) [Rhodovastum atsumiense]|uniref:Uncharacterized protein n=1 Tax=Rhodovastum atsumiense TaxID=504468 RepID=A0A5M6IVG4_9PROT|nr:hypothetical protein [Rhodovastum atsumiense]KAA5611548.1 hypothetical protein F1189_13355 [Rhodovastum atsumiense]CAH2606226.1 conserved protein of unknown function [Rhodovastum atsumiense]
MDEMTTAAPQQNDGGAAEAAVNAIRETIARETAGLRNGDRLLLCGIALGEFIDTETQGDPGTALAVAAMLNGYVSNTVASLMMARQQKDEVEAEGVRVAAEAQQAAAAAEAHAELGEILAAQGPCDAVAVPEKA